MVKKIALVNPNIFKSTIPNQYNMYSFSGE